MSKKKNGITKIYQMIEVIISQYELNVRLLNNETECEGLNVQLNMRLK